MAGSSTPVAPTPTVDTADESLHEGMMVEAYRRVSAKAIELYKPCFDIVEHPIGPPIPKTKRPVQLFMVKPHTIAGLKHVITEFEKDPHTFGFQANGQMELTLDVPYPPEDPQEGQNSAPASSDIGGKPVTQDDITLSIRIWTSLVEYISYKHAKIDSDIMSLVGSLIKPHGLTWNKQGLFFRLPSIESSGHKKMSCVKLTDDKKAAMAYLGLNFEHYGDHKNFKTWDDVIEYAATCHFYNPSQWKIPNDKNFGTAKAAKPKAEAAAEKNNLFHYWTTSYLPSQARMYEKTYTPVCHGHEEALARARRLFPAFGRRVDSVKATKEQQVREMEMFRVLRSVVPEVKENKRLHGTALNGLKAVIRKGVKAFKNDKYAIVGGPDTPAELLAVKEAWDLCDIGRFLAEAQKNWPLAVALQEYKGRFGRMPIKKSKKSKKVTEKSDAGDEKANKPTERPAGGETKNEGSASRDEAETQPTSDSEAGRPSSSIEGSVQTTDTNATDPNVDQHDEETPRNKPHQALTNLLSTTETGSPKPKDKRAKKKSKQAKVQDEEEAKDKSSGGGGGGGGPNNLKK